jgi:hypothetical protein
MGFLPRCLRPTGFQIGTELIFVHRDGSARDEVSGVFANVG